jgi:glycine cleavage system aminomethyltransferase T
MALVENGRSRMGEYVAVVVRGKAVMARIADCRFYDVKGARLDG